MSLAWCLICPGSTVLDLETGHYGTVREIRDEWALVFDPMLGENWVSTGDLELVPDGRRR
jgi:hypothetical protein